jgi:hypothetical protein
MPRIRPLRAISLGGSPAVGGVWDDSRLADAADDPPQPGLRVKPLTDGSGWHASVIAGKLEIGRVAYLPGEPAGPWRWAIRFGADGRAARRRWRHWRGRGRGSAATLSLLVAKAPRFTPGHPLAGGPDNAQRQRLEIPGRFDCCLSAPQGALVGSHDARIVRGPRCAPALALHRCGTESFAAGGVWGVQTRPPETIPLALVSSTSSGGLLRGESAAWWHEILGQPQIV